MRLFIIKLVIRIVNYLLWRKKKPRSNEESLIHTLNIEFHSGQNSVSLVYINRMTTVDYVD